MQCWISQDYEAHRLYLHYVWIFIAELGSLIIYAFVFTILRRRLTGLAAPVMYDGDNGTTVSTSSSIDDHGKLGGSKAITTTTVATNQFIAPDPFAPTRQRVSRAAKYMVWSCLVSIYLGRANNFQRSLIQLSTSH